MILEVRLGEKAKAQGEEATWLGNISAIASSQGMNIPAHILAAPWAGLRSPGV